LVAVGQCSITANQAGDSSHVAAAPVTQTFNVLKGSQTINFNQPADTALTAGPVTLTATATSGLSVAFASNTSSVCTVSGSSATLVAVGQCSITASQSGNASYNPATAVTKTFNVTQGTRITPTITWANPADIQFGSALGGTQLNATASVPGTFAYTPALGTVLPVGNGQTLSVLFTPTNTATYTTATATAQINVLPTNGPGQLVLTNALARDQNTDEVVATLTFANTAGF